MSEINVLNSIDQLRRDLNGYHGQLKAHDDLQRHCDNQRKRISELEGLYAKAKSENDKLQKERDHWHVEQVHAYGNWEDAHKRAIELEAENAELRELAVLQSVVFKYMSTCPTTDCQICPVNEECAESVHLEGVLGIDDKETSWLVQGRNEDAADVRTENAKLRELVKDMWQFTGEACRRYPRLFDPPAQGGQSVQPNGLKEFEKRIEELGIGVNEGMS